MIKSKHDNANKIVGIQLLRGLAALFVVMFHIQLIAHKNGMESQIVQNKFFSHMYFGVDIFFVISGFIMAKTVLGNSISGVQFLKRRIIRVVPLYWSLTLFLFLAINLIADRIGIEKYVIRDLVFSFSFINTFQQQIPIIDQGWSLEYEMLFYSIIAISLLFLKQGPALIFSSFLILVFCYFGFDPIIMEFIFGMIVYYFQDRFNFGNLALKLILICGILGFMLASLYDIGNENRTWTYGIFATLIVLGFTFEFPFSNRIPILLGDISYSLYLSQTLILWWLVKLAIHLPTISLRIFSLLVLIPASCIFVAYYVHKLVEKPLNRRIKLLLS